MNMIEILYKFKNILPKETYLYEEVRNYYYHYMVNYHYISFLKYRFKKILGYELNLENPQTFNEKIQWLKCYYRDPLMGVCADKVAVREFIKEIIGEEYLTPIYGVYNTPEEINFNLLPDSFVLKTNHASGQVIVCKDKSKIDFQKIKQQLNKWLRYNYYYLSGEWVYRNIKPKVICEKLLGSSVNDYKFYCFNGEPQILLVCSERANGVKMNHYDMQLEELELHRNEKECGKPQLPKNFELMKSMVRLLANSFPFVRVDLYEVEGKIYFGEMTFFPASGTAKYEPIEWDYKLGEMLNLNYCKKNYIRYK